MGCEVKKDATGQVTRIVCSRTPTASCDFCRKRPGTQLCDYPTAKGKTCDKHICLSCTARPKGKDEDYCPDHRERAGLGSVAKRELDLSGARWLREAKYANRCLTQSCNASVQVGDRCFYLPAERGVMCEECGENV